MKKYLGCLALALCVTAHGQIKYTAMFDGVKLANPLAFWGIPGKPDMFMATEGYAGNVVVIHKAGGSWSKTVVHHQDVSTTGSSEQGLLGLCLHPNFKTNRKYYINYNPKGNLSTQIEERELDETLLKDAGKSRKIFSIPQDKANHKGGTIAFNPKDGFFYVGMGDGQTGARAQDKNSLFGKVLRVDVDKPSGGKEYGIPADNPFANGGGAPEVFAYGFRNPWRWSFDPLDGTLWLGDVGNSAQEEVDIVVKGGNYGWPIAEGNNGNTADHVKPVMWYNNSRSGAGDGTAIVGGTVYRGNPASPYYGSVFISDCNSRKVWSLKRTGEKKTEPSPASQPCAFGTDDQGYMYLVGYSSGTIYRMDSPDLGPMTVNVWDDRPGHLREQAKRTFQAVHGGKLDVEAFGGSERLEAYALSGNRIAEVRKDRALEMRPGLYLIKSPGVAAPTNLLIVR